ncbi:asparagine synthase (glutamine-hydrolyzing) [Achromobacter pulmonis]|nr:asparagine synthase (glutamine-hydrolyzing) [Achromobacter pulmonis]
MCGILGGWWASPPQDLASRLSSGLAQLRQRGPNDQGREIISAPTGVVAMGQTRLSIIDLSTGGHQPMSSPDGALTVVFNGEIYNYRELRAELKLLGHHFSSDSDTEVLLAAWHQWGSAALRRFVGMFAFTMHDRRTHTLTLARDAFGIKPLYYHHTPDTIAFASEPRALMTLDAHPPTLDIQAAYDYLVHGHYDHTERTFVRGISSLPPAHFLRLSIHTGKLDTPVRWWSPTIDERHPRLSYADAAAELRERFLNNVRLHLRSDVTLGAALSGGVDSSAIVCAMRHVEPELQLRTFSFISQSQDRSEEKWVDIVNSNTGAIANKVRITADELAKDIDDLITAQGEPFGSTSIYAQYRVFKAARAAGVTVMLEGQGADELIAGYNGYPAQRLVSLLESGRLPTAIRHLLNQRNWPGRSIKASLQEAVGVMAGDRLYQRLRKLSGRDPRPTWLDLDTLNDAGVQMQYPRAVWSESARGRRAMAEMAVSLTQRGLGWLLRHGDRNSMRFSIESRVPFLTPDLADFLMGLPEDYLVSVQGETKRLLRTAMQGIVPETILARKDKIGFETPELAWLRNLAPQIRQWLAPSEGSALLDNAQMLEHFDEMIEGRRPFNWQIWRWINFQRWVQLNGIKD